LLTSLISVNITPQTCTGLPVSFDQCPDGKTGCCDNQNNPSVRGIAQDRQTAFLSFF